MYVHVFDRIFILVTFRINAEITPSHSLCIQMIPEIVLLVLQYFKLNVFHIL